MTLQPLTSFLARRPRKNRSSIVIIISLVCIYWSLTGTVAGEQAGDGRELVLNTPIERELSGGETHAYKIALAAGDYVRLFISPHSQSMKLESRLLAPGGSSDIGVYFFPTGGSERFISLIAEVSGDYRLEIRPAGSDGKAERYTVKIGDLRPATEQDRGRVAAERVEREGRTLTNNPFSGTGSLERFRQGIAKCEEALVLWRRLGGGEGELRMLAYLGTQYRELGELQTALEYGKQAIQMARTLGDSYQEANLMLVLGNISRSLGKNQEALDLYNQARQLFSTSSKRYGEAVALYNIGITFRALGEWENALPYFELALPTYSSLGDSSGECQILNAMGTIHGALGNKQKAIEFHNRALEIARTHHFLNLEALSLRIIGDANLELSDKQTALRFYEQSLKLSRTAEHPRFEADALRAIGDVLYLLGDHQKALDCLNQSLTLFRTNGERLREARVLHSLAQVNYSLGNFDEAKKQIEQALEIQESLRANVVSQQLRDTIFTSAQSSFAFYVDLLMELHKKNSGAGHEAAALQASERARARSLLELLSESQADIRQSVPRHLLELERSLQQQFNSKAEARTRLLSDKSTQSQGAAFDKEIAELAARHREVEVQIRQSSPNYAALTQPQPLSASEIQQQLDDNTVLLEFALGEKHSWLWAVTRSSIDSYQLAASNEIEAPARRVYELLTARQPRKGESVDQYEARISDAEAKFQTQSAILSEILLGQIAAKLQREWKGKRLAIVASGALEYIPFAALPLTAVSGQQNAVGPQSAIRNPQSSEPLIAQHEIVNLPSASALATIRSETGGRKGAEKTLAIIADPVFEANDPRLLNALNKPANNTIITSVRSGEDGSTSSGSQPSTKPDSDMARSLRSFNFINERGGFHRLPFSREEADAIASLTSSKSLMKATDFQASRKIVTSGELARYRIVHFATHGLLNSEHPELSGLVLSLVDEAGKPQDGFLRMYEIYNLHLPADLVVLSACQTALGKQIKGEGLVGLTRGFMYAGAQRVVASLWQVDDLATAELMKRFYRGMVKGGLRPAEALRLAQLDMSKQKRWSSPYFWAAFTIQGEWR